MNEAFQAAAAFFAEHPHPQLCYHDWAHSAWVAEQAKAVGRFVLGEPQCEWLAIAAAWHDAGYLLSMEEHEEKSIELALAWMQAQGYEAAAQEYVRACIRATKPHEIPQELGPSLLKDLDLAYGIAEQYAENSPKLRREWELCLDRQYSDEAWTTLQRNFLSQAQFYSEYGKTFFEPAKQKNLLSLV